MYVYFFIKCVVRWSENSMRFEKSYGKWLSDVRYGMCENCVLNSIESDAKDSESFWIDPQVSWFWGSEFGEYCFFWAKCTLRKFQTSNYHLFLQTPHPSQPRPSCHSGHSLSPYHSRPENYGTKVCLHKISETKKYYASDSEKTEFKIQGIDPAPYFINFWSHYLCLL